MTPLVTVQASAGLAFDLMQNVQPVKSLPLKSSMPLAGAVPGEISAAAHFSQFARAKKNVAARQIESLFFMIGKIWRADVASQARLVPIRIFENPSLCLRLKHQQIGYGGMTLRVFEAVKIRAVEPVTIRLVRFQFHLQDTRAMIGV